VSAHLRIVRGNPTDDEVAALVAVVTSLDTEAPDEPEQPVRSAWSDRRALLRAPLTHGPGAWRASGLPR
jgi:hypothetical protein